MATAHEIRQKTEQRETQRTFTQAGQIRTAASDQIDGLLTGLVETAHQIVGYRKDRDVNDAEQKEWHSLHPSFSNPSDETVTFLMTTAVMLLLIYPAVYCLDTFLLSGNASKIAKDFAQGNQALIWVAIFAIPLAVLLTEAYFQTQWSVATTAPQKWLWKSGAVLMTIAMPLIIVGLGTSTSVNNGGARGAAVANWNLLGKGVLAFFAHAAILLGGKRLHEAKNFLVYKIKDKRFERESKRLGQEIGPCERMLTNSFTQYFLALNNFNAANEPPIESGPFDDVTRSEVNRVFGYKIIAEIPPIEDEAEDGSRIGSNNGSNHGSAVGVATSNSQPPVEPNQDFQPLDSGFAFDMDGEDEVRA